MIPNGTFAYVSKPGKSVMAARVIASDNEEYTLRLRKDDTTIQAAISEVWTTFPSMTKS